MGVSAYSTLEEYRSGRGAENVCPQQGLGAVLAQGLRHDVPPAVRARTSGPGRPVRSRGPFSSSMSGRSP